MADVIESTSSVVSEENENIVKDDLYYEPEQKKLKVESSSSDVNQKLEDRLSGILCCAVCLDLPQTCFQCSNGHLMCAGCFNHLLADARLKDETATCPNCRCEIGKTTCLRNLAVEKAVSELPSQCQYCNCQLPRHLLSYHEQEQCQESSIGWLEWFGRKHRGTCVVAYLSLPLDSGRLLDGSEVDQFGDLYNQPINSGKPCSCKYTRIGCRWRGPYHELQGHEETCIHPRKSGEEIMEALQLIQNQQEEKLKMYNDIFNLLSLEKVTFNDLQLKPYRTDDFLTKLFYETSRFTAFNQQWVIKAKVLHDQKDPTQSIQRSLAYQLVLKGKLTQPMSVYFIALKGPYGDTRIDQAVYFHEFTADSSETELHELPILDSIECNKLLAAKTINLRLIMFQLPGK